MGVRRGEIERQRRGERGRRGQFIIIAVLMIAIMVVSIAAVMYSSVTYFRHERWEEYLTIVDNVRIGSTRLVEMALANFTKTCFETRVMDRSIFTDILDRWKTDLMRGMAGQGLAVDFLKGDKLLSSVPERRIDDFVKLYWYSPVSVTAFYADLSVNLSKSGLYGFKAPIFICISLEVDTNYTRLEPEPDCIYNLNVTVTREDQFPVTGLTADNFVVQRFNTSVNEWVSANISKATPWCGGNYTLTFEQPIEEPYYKWLFVGLEDERGITVVVSSTYSYIEFIVEKQTPTSGRPYNTDDEIYTLESGVNGTWYWNGKQMNVTEEATLPPIPPLPIKQFRVNVTENGVDSQSVISPCQYEIWEKINWHGRLIDVPKDLADPHYLFNSTNRIVFQVKFPTLEVTRQKVTLWWMDDMDAEPYQGPSDLEYNSGLWQVQTNRYKVEFIGVGHTQSPDYPYDYHGVAALVMKDPTSGLCFGPWNLHAFGICGGLAAWRPYGQWQIKYWYGGTGARAVVRLIAILNSTEVQCVYHEQHHSNNYYDTYAVVFITANVKYLQTNVHIYWKESQTDDGLWFASVMGKGEPKWYAYLNNNTGSIAGPYDYNYVHRKHREYEYPGYWGAHWNEQFGRGLVINNRGLECLKSFDADRTRFSVTESAPGGSNQGSIEFEAVNCRGPAYTIADGVSYSYIWAMWMYGGGSKTEGYKEVNYYYWMFLESYSPTIIIGEGG